MVDSITEDDLNRWDKDIKAENIESKAEWLKRMRDREYDKKIDPIAQQYWYEQRIEGYIEKNRPKKVEYFRKGRKFYRAPKRKWTKEEENFIINNLNLKPLQLHKLSLFAGRTKKGIISKRYRLIRRKYEAVPKGYGKKWERRRYNVR